MAIDRSGESSSSTAPATEAAAQQMQETLAPHRHLVLFAQEVLCWERPLWAVGVAVVAHVVWMLIALNNLPPLAFICALGLALLVIDGCIVLGRIYLPIRLHHLPALLQVSERPTKETRKIAGLTVQPLRTFDELVVVADDWASAVQTHTTSLFRMRQAHFGQATVFCITVCLLLAYTTSFFNGSFLLYLPVLILLLGPPLERVLVVRVGLARGMVYARMAAVALLHFSNVVWTTFCIEPVTGDELKRRSSAIELALGAALGQQNSTQQPLQSLQVNAAGAAKVDRRESSGLSSGLGSDLHASISEDGFEMIGRDDLS